MKKIIFLFLTLLVIQSNCLAQHVKFGIISDLHTDFMPDASKRLQKFLDASKKAKVDFIIDLGDFVIANKKNQFIVDQWNGYQGEKYHVIGNHDNDTYTKQQYMDFIGMSQRYYSFDKGDIHFVVLDANNLCKDGNYIPYGKSNFYVNPAYRAFVDPEQVAWLKKDLSNTKLRCVIFSHQSLEMCVGNREEIRAILEEENQRAGFKKVVACINGHHHTNYEKEINGIVYIQINSASYKYMGSKYANTSRFTPEDHKKYPGLKDTLPWKDALYAIVTINKKGLKLKGTESEFIPPTLEDLGIPANFRPTPTVPWIKDFKMKF